MASSTGKKRKRALQTENRLRTGMFYAIEILIDIIILYFILKGFAWGYNFAYDVFNDDVKYAGVTSAVEFKITEDEDYKEVCTALYEEELIKDKYVMMAKLKLGSYTDSIQTGTYSLKASMSYDEIMNEICGLSEEEEEDNSSSTTKEANDSSKTGGTGSEKSDDEDASEETSEETETTATEE